VGKAAFTVHFDAGRRRVDLTYHPDHRAIQAV
jgi:hypothetical protein